jgi:hypothetical protein
VGHSLYTKGNLLLCKRDYLRLFGSTGYCAACKKVKLTGYCARNKVTKNCLLTVLPRIRYQLRGNCVARNKVTTDRLLYFL